MQQLQATGRWPRKELLHAGMLCNEGNTCNSILLAQLLTHAALQNHIGRQNVTPSRFSMEESRSGGTTFPHLISWRPKMSLVGSY